MRPELEDGVDGLRLCTGFVIAGGLVRRADQFGDVVGHPTLDDVVVGRQAKLINDRSPKGQDILRR